MRKQTILSLLSMTLKVCKSCFFTDSSLKTVNVFFLFYLHTLICIYYGGVAVMLK